MHTKLSLGLVTLALTGCSTFDVYKSGDSTAQKGIPFYVKVPVLSQDTQLAEKQLLVQVTVSQVLVEEGQDEKVLTSQDFPPSGPLRLVDTPESRRALDDLIKSIPEGDGVAYQDTTRSVGGTGLPNLATRFPTLNIDKGQCSGLDSRLLTLANSWQSSMIVGPEVYYLTTKHPLFGSASFDFEFAADGTLTKASGTVTDETAKTILGLFPITAKLTKQWGLSEQTAKSSDSQKALMAKILTNGTKRVVVRVEATTTAVARVYALKKLRQLTTADLQDRKYVSSANAPLSLCNALNGTDGVQLVSISDGIAKPEKGDDASAWKLQGTATPPKDGGK